MDLLTLENVPPVFGAPIVIVILLIVKWSSPSLAAKKWPMPLLALGVSFLLGFLTIKNLPWRDIAGQCIFVAVAAMYLFSGTKAIGKAAIAGWKALPDSGSVAGLLVFALLPTLLLTSCARGGAVRTTKYSSAGHELGRVDVLPEKIATGADGVVLFDKEGVALKDHKDQVVWRFREKGRDDDNLEHWSKGIFESLGTGFTAMTAFAGDPFAAAAFAATMNASLFPPIFDTAVPDYGVALDIEIRASGDKLRAVVTKSMKNNVESSDLEQKSGKAVTDLKNGPFVTGAFFGDLTDADRAFIKDLFATDLTPTEPEVVEEQAEDITEETADGT